MKKHLTALHHKFILSSLETNNFGLDIIKWVKCFNQGDNSSVLNAGPMSDFFVVNRGARKGCPLSPYLFILCIEILSATIFNDHDITGIKLYGKEFKSTMFADEKYEIHTVFSVGENIRNNVF